MFRIKCKCLKNLRTSLVYSPRAGKDNPLGTKFWCQQKFLITLPICCQFKKISLKSDLSPFFMCFFHKYIAPDRGRQPIGDKNFMTTERPFLFAHMLQVSKWSFRNLILYIFLMIFYMYIVPGQGQKTPWGQTFDVNRKPLPLQPFVASFKQINLNSDLIHIFNVLPQVHSPGVGADNPLWTKFWCQQKGLVTLPICCKFKKNIFGFYTYYCLLLYMYIAPGQGQNFYFNLNLLSLWSFAVSFFHKMTFQQFFQYKTIRDQIWPCCKIAHSQTSVIIRTNYDGPPSPQHYIPSTRSLALWFWRRRFLKGFYHIWAWWPSWSCDPHPLNKLSFPHPTEARYEIWLW